jgi:hypothetical protein
MRLQKILERLTTGIGATVLPPSVKQINITMQRHTSYYSIRYFIRENLRRIQYQNPDIKIFIERVDQFQKPKIKVLLEDGTVKEMTVKERKLHSDQVCKQLFTLLNHDTNQK